MESDVVARLTALELRVRVIETRLSANPALIEVARKPLSIQEFLSSKGPKTDLERTLFLGYYLEKNSAISPFNLADLRDAFRQARQPLPANLSDSVNKNIQKGLIMEVQERKSGLKSWVLTNTGEQEVNHANSGAH